MDEASERFTEEDLAAAQPFAVDPAEAQPAAVFLAVRRREDLRDPESGASSQERQRWAGWVEAVARAHNDHSVAPALLGEAAELWWAAGDVLRAEGLLLLLGHHPLAHAAMRADALHRASVVARIRGDLSGMFARLNEMVRETANLDPVRYASYHLAAFLAPLDKANVLLYRYRKGLPIPEDLPAEDRGKRASDYYEEVLGGLNDPGFALPDWPAPDMEVALLQDLTEALAYEGQTGRAREVFQTTVRRDDCEYPGAFLKRFAHAVDPQEGETYVNLLEEMENDLPSAELRRHASRMVATWYLSKAGLGRPFLERMEALRRTGPPEARQALVWPLKPQVLLKYARACLKPDVRDTRRAIRYYEAYLNLYPSDKDFHAGNYLVVLRDLADLYASDQIRDYAKALDCLYRILDDPRYEEVFRPAGIIEQQIEQLEALAAIRGQARTGQEPGEGPAAKEDPNVQVP